MPNAPLRHVIDALRSPISVPPFLRCETVPPVSSVAIRFQDTRVLISIAPHARRQRTIEIRRETVWLMNTDPAPVLLPCDATMIAHPLVARVRAEFLEMPGLQLTVPQAQRLWGLDADACRTVIEALVEASFLRWTPSGTVIRAGK